MEKDESMAGIIEARVTALALRMEGEEMEKAKKVKSAKKKLPEAKERFKIALDKEVRHYFMRKWKIFLFNLLKNYFFKFLTLKIYF